MKISNSGDQLWSNEYGDIYQDEGFACCELASGNYCFVGAISMIPLHPDIWVLYISPDGDSLNTNIFSSAGHDFAHSVVPLEDGNAVMAGWLSYDGFLLNFTYDGAEVWRHLVGGVRDDRLVSLVQKEDGGYYAAGYTKSYGIGTPDSPNYFVISSDAGGDPGSDCYPAFIWSPSPYPDSSYVACTDLSVFFQISDPYLTEIDEDRVWISRYVEHIDGSVDTTRFAGDAEVPMTHRDDTLNIMFNGDYETGDMVTVIVDSCYNIDDCLTVLDFSNTFFFDTDMPVLGEINPAPSSEIEFDGVSDINFSFTASDEGSGLNEDEMFITWGRFRNSIRMWMFTDSVRGEFSAVIPPAGYSVGDSIKICLHVSDMTIMAADCPQNVIDTCIVYDLVSSGGVEYTYNLQRGWNLISSPFSETMDIVADFPDHVDAPYRWSNTTSSYQTISEADAGTGFWILYPDSAEIPLISDGFSSGMRHILERGWNLIGVDGEEVPANLFTDESGIVPPVFGYEGGSFAGVDTLYPGKAYWVLVTSRTEIDI